MPSEQPDHKGPQVPLDQVPLVLVVPLDHKGPQVPLD